MDVFPFNLLYSLLSCVNCYTQVIPSVTHHSLSLSLCVCVNVKEETLDRMNTRMILQDSYRPQDKSAIRYHPGLRAPSFFRLRHIAREPRDSIHWDRVQLLLHRSGGAVGLFAKADRDRAPPRRQPLVAHTKAAPKRSSDFRGLPGSCRVRSAALTPCTARARPREFLTCSLSNPGGPRKPGR